MEMTGIGTAMGDERHEKGWSGEISKKALPESADDFEEGYHNMLVWVLSNVQNEVAIYEMGRSEGGQSLQSRSGRGMGPRVCFRTYELIKPRCEPSPTYQRLPSSTL